MYIVLSIRTPKTFSFATNRIFIFLCPYTVKRTSDSCHANLPVKLVKIKCLIYPRIYLEIYSFQLPLKIVSLIYFMVSEINILTKFR